MAPKSTKFLDYYGYDLILALVAAFYVFFIPYTKVEESFNMQGMHDILYHRHHLDEYDHLDFPGVVPRTFIGAWIVSILASPFVSVINLLHLPKIYSLLIVRLVLGCIILSTLRFFRLQIRSVFGLQVEAFFVILTALQFHLLFYSTRPLPNILALGLVNMAYGYWLKGSCYTALQFLVVATLIFRCDVLLLACPIGLQLLLTRSVTLLKAIKCCVAAAILSIGLTVMVDSIMWRRVVWPEFEVFWFNSVLNKSSEWGVSPFHWYFTSALPRALLAAYPLVMVSVKMMCTTCCISSHFLRRGQAFYMKLPLPYNVMMTLYMKLNEYDQVEKLVSEMKQKNIQLDLYTYNIWLSARGSYGSAEGMEEVFEEMKLQPTIVPNWTTFSTIAAVYIKLGMLEKAEQCLKDLETRITGRDRMPYHYLISLYGSLGKKDEVYRVWSIYKSAFSNIPNWGYHSVISALIRLGDIEEAEKLFEEWLPAKASYDPKVANLLMGWYVREEPFEKAKSFFDRMVEGGGKPNSGSWEILGEGHLKEGRISEALSCYREAALAETPKHWKPKPSNVTAFLEKCEQQADHTSKEDFVLLLRQLGCFQDETYRPLLVGHGDAELGESEEKLVLNNKNNETEGEESGMLFSVTE